MCCVVISVILLAVLQVELSYSYCTENKLRILNDGNLIPALGYGTFTEIPDLDKVRSSVIFAIESGFRLLDTADVYANEHLIGEALTDVFQRGVVRREEMFITTKLDIATRTREMVITSLKQSLRRLQLDFVNLLLIHTPYNPLSYPNYDFLDVWKGMEDAKELGLTKSIGVSNFNSTHINKLLTHARIRPAVNEIHVSLNYTNLDLVAYCQSQGIVVVAYSPFGYLVPRTYISKPVPPTLQDPVLMKIAKKYGKDTSQVVLRYFMDRGVIPIPKSHNASHTLLNVDLFDFSLSPEEIYTINEFSTNTPIFPINDGDAMTMYFLLAYELYKDLRQ